MQRGKKRSARGNEENRSGTNDPPEQGGDEAAGGRGDGCGPRQDFMHGGQGQAALGKKGIQRRQAEGQNPDGSGISRLSGDQPAQFMQDFGAFSAVWGEE